MYGILSGFLWFPWRNELLVKIVLMARQRNSWNNLISFWLKQAPVQPKYQGFIIFLHLRTIKNSLSCLSHKKASKVLFNFCYFEILWSILRRTMLNIQWTFTFPVDSWEIKALFYVINRSTPRRQLLWKYLNINSWTKIFKITNKCTYCFN